MQLENQNVNNIVAYAPTLTINKKDPKCRDGFFDQLDHLTTKHEKDKHLLLVLEDFNAETGSGCTRFPENKEKYGKSQINSNGEQMLQCVKENDCYCQIRYFPIKWQNGLRGDLSNVCNYS